MTAPVEGRLGTGAPLAAFAAQQLPMIERGLAEALGTPDGLSDRVGREIRSAVGVNGVPGSRWRPLLTLGTAHACGGSLAETLPVALAVELTHTASLVLDDLPCMDDSQERRGRPASHRSVGAGGAILLAVSMLARAAELLGTTPRVGGQLSAEWGASFGLAGMAGGQAVDLTGAFAGGGAARRLHRKKTTGLSIFAVRAGAITAGASPSLLRSLTGFGEDLGWAYQLADDANDWKEDGRLGKGPGGRSPERQSGRLLQRSLRRLHQAEELSPGGRALLTGLAQRCVPLSPDAGALRWG